MKSVFTYEYQQPTHITDFTYDDENTMLESRKRVPRHLEELGFEEPYFVELGPGKFADEMPERVKIGLNEQADPGCEVYYDLNYGIPLLARSVARIHSGQVLEHITNIIFLMNEMWRVLIPGGIAWHAVPFYLGPHSWSDPTHVRAFTENSFKYFCQREDGTPFVENFADYGIDCNFILVDQKIVGGNQGLEVTLRKPEDMK